MRESDFVDIFRAAAAEALADQYADQYKVVRKAFLFYRFGLNHQLELAVSDIKNPKRGRSAFETDLCVYETVNGLLFPRVVIEFKTSPTSHDVLTYSAKAGRHKSLYPCLRYGLLASDWSSIPGKFFVHNEHMDFCIAAKQYRGEDQLKPFAARLIEKELEASRMLEQVHFGKRKYDYYYTDVVFRSFNDGD